MKLGTKLEGRATARIDNFPRPKLRRTTIICIILFRPLGSGGVLLTAMPNPSLREAPDPSPTEAPTESPTDSPTEEPTWALTDPPNLPTTNYPTECFIQTTLLQLAADDAKGAKTIWD